MASSTWFEKEARIKLILNNPVYMPSSGVYRQLQKGLRKLSKFDLGNLLLVISQKHNTEPEDGK